MVNDFFSICQCDHRYVLSENFSGIAYIVVVNYVFRALTSLKCQRIGSRRQQSLEKPVSGQILRILVSLRCILKHFPTLCYMAPTGPWKRGKSVYTYENKELYICTGLETTLSGNSDWKKEKATLEKSRPRLNFV